MFDLQNDIDRRMKYLDRALVQPKLVQIVTDRQRTDEERCEALITLVGEAETSPDAQRKLDQVAAMLGDEYVRLLDWTIDRELAQWPDGGKAVLEEVVKELNHA